MSKRKTDIPTDFWLKKILKFGDHEAFRRLKNRKPDTVTYLRALSVASQDKTCPMYLAMCLDQCKLTNDHVISFAQRGDATLLAASSLLIQTEIVLDLAMEHGNREIMVWFRDQLKKGTIERYRLDLWFYSLKYDRVELADLLFPFDNSEEMKQSCLEYARVNDASRLHIYLLSKPV